jgi:hypothetical protein
VFVERLLQFTILKSPFGQTARSGAIAPTLEPGSESNKEEE